MIDDFNETLLAQGREKLAYPSDEFYQLAGRAIPPYDYYGDFPQLENGVGMLANTEYEFMSALAEAEPDLETRKFALVTGMAAFELQSRLARAFCEKYTCSDIRVYGIENVFFGPDVTVAGLLTGTDIINYFKENPAGYDTLVFPSVMFKSREEQVFLDDVTLQDLEKQLGINAVITDCSGSSLFDLFYGLKK